MVIEHDVFISYSHSADRVTAQRLQSALQIIGKPWYKRRGLKVFRDETDLEASPQGWPLIESALESSRFMILLASPDAAKSKWVAKEVEYWLKIHSAEKLLIVLTKGNLIWSNDTNQFQLSGESPLPGSLVNAFKEEPFWVDFSDLNIGKGLSLKDQTHLNRVSRLVAPIKGITVDRLINEVHRQHRNTIKTVVAVMLLLFGLSLAAFWQFLQSEAAQEREVDQKVLKLISDAYAKLYIDPLMAFDAAYRAQQIKPTTEGEQVLTLASEVSKKRGVNKNEEAQLLGAGVGYMMERWREGEVFSKIREDGRYLLLASKRGKSGSNPPGKVFLVSLDTMRTVELLAGDQASGRRLEYMGFAASNDEIFVARQFYLDIYDLEGNLINSTQLEYHAKPTHLIAGRFDGHVLVGDTVGNLMLADTDGTDRPQLHGGARRDAPIHIETHSEKPYAIVIFESGRADFFDFSDINNPLQHQFSKTGVIFCGFSKLPGSMKFVAGFEDGRIEIYSYSAGVAKKVLALSADSVASVDLASFSNDDQRVIVLREDGKMEVWSLETGKLIIVES